MEDVTYNQVTPQLIQELQAIVPGKVHKNEEINEDYFHDEMPIYGKGIPEVVIEATTTEDIAAIVKLCFEHNIPVIPRGAGTGLTGAAVAIHGGVLLDMSKMNKILNYDEENFVVRVQPGVLLNDLAEDAKNKGLLYPPDPGEKFATLGGNVSTNAGGMRAVKYGCTRDYVRAMTVVLPTGEIIHLGASVSKTSTGYSLINLMIGSEGTLGIITELTLKVIPAPKETISLIVPFENLEDCIGAVPKIFRAGLKPQALEFMEKEIVLSSERYLGKHVFPTEVEGVDIGAYLLITFDGDIPVYRRKGVVIGALAVLALAIIGGSYALYKGTHSQSAKTTSTASSAVTSSSSKDTSAADNKAFEEMYKNFFTDDEQTKLANDQFGKLSDLEKLLKKLEKTKYYDAAKKKYDNLKKQIEAVQKINSQFESDALVDGSYNASIAVKSDANFNNLPESVTTTGNASLDSTIQEAIKGGKTQLEEKAKAASATSAATASESVNTASPAAPSGDNASGAASNGGGAAASNTSGAQNGAANSAGSAGSTGATGGTTGGSAAASTVVTRGITNYNPSILQRDRSRVPYNANVVADTSNPAWTWADGVLDKIINDSHSRGYFSGDNFILEPVNIINGNGYYNLYLPDGTYLFSINCKTGYYVGNGSGHSDKLDYE